MMTTVQERGISRATTINDVLLCISEITWKAIGKECKNLAAFSLYRGRPTLSFEFHAFVRPKDLIYYI